MLLSKLASLLQQKEPSTVARINTIQSESAAIRTDWFLIRKRGSKGYITGGLGLGSTGFGSTGSTGSTGLVLLVTSIPTVKLEK